MTSLEKRGTKPHSADYFGRQRNYWWNDDFLALMATRLRLGEARTVLDVGSGVGHWGRCLAAHLSPEAKVCGIDREPEWVRKATDVAVAAGLGERFRYVSGDAATLPFL